MCGVYSLWLGLCWTKETVSIEKRLRLELINWLLHRGTKWWCCCCWCRWWWWLWWWWWWKRQECIAEYKLKLVNSISSSLTNVCKQITTLRIRIHVLPSMQNKRGNIRSSINNLFWLHNRVVDPDNARAHFLMAAAEGAASRCASERFADSFPLCKPKQWELSNIQW